MTEQLLIRVDPELKRKLAKLATMEGRTATDVVRGLIENYVRQRDMSSYVDSLWSRIGQRLKAGGSGPKDVARAIRAVRKSTTRDAGRR